jgi:PAS domain-containing protein
MLLRESAKRARFIARQIVDLNSAAIAAKAETRTTVGRIAQEPEVRVAYLVDLDGRIIAPSERMNQLLTADAEAAAVVRARQLYRSATNSGFHMAHGPIVVGVEPLEVFNGQLGKNVISAIAVVSIDTRYASGEMSEVSMIYSETFVMMALMSGLLFLVLYRMTLKPFEVLNEDIDKVLKGEMDQVTREFKFSEMAQLWDVINSALQRIPKGSDSGGMGSIGGMEEDFSAENYLGAAKALGGTHGIAVALLDGHGAVQYLNEMFEEITGLRSDNVVGQPLVSVARDQAFGSFVTDVIERTATGTDGVSEDFEFSGVTYKIRVGAYGPVGGKGRSFLMVASKAD